MCYLMLILIYVKYLTFKGNFEVIFFYLILLSKNSKKKLNGSPEIIKFPWSHLDVAPWRGHLPFEKQWAM